MEIESRPKCPSCYGEGKDKDPLFGGMLPCFYCDGQGYDPYYTGKKKEENDDDGE